MAWQMLIPWPDGVRRVYRARDGAKIAMRYHSGFDGRYIDCSPRRTNVTVYSAGRSGQQNPPWRRPLRDAMQEWSGTFEKAAVCPADRKPVRHSTGRQPALFQLSGLCPTGAITSAGETCRNRHDLRGCGSCSAVVPVRAAKYDYDARPVIRCPPVSTLASTYRKAGGNARACVR